ncbi:MAG: hypothetical protein P1Q69_08790 [Candidatus Thorarchaeota archaeon]|nr:hypothetical protein [Candidatus Thorarchaeota archaeon]
MNSESPLSNWHFLIGKWKGGSTDQYGDKGEIVSTVTFSMELGKYIIGKHDSYRNGKLENASIGVMFYDLRNELMRRKTFFSYGFVNNEVEYHRTESEILFEVISEPVPQAFDGMKWRSYLRKVSDTEIRIGLESAKGGEDFTSYGETILRKSA